MRVDGKPGSYNQDPNGRWRWVLGYSWADGRRQFQRRGFASLDQAVQSCAAFDHAYRQVNAGGIAAAHRSAYSRACALILQEDAQAFIFVSTDETPRLYVARIDGRYIKIGISNNPKRRMQEFRSSLSAMRLRPADLTAGPVEWLYDWPGGRVAESNLHRLFRNYQVIGEWFWADPHLLNVLMMLDQKWLESVA